MTIKELKDEHVNGVCLDMRKQEKCFNNWGVSNTPLNDKSTDKKVVIDWISYTFSDIEYDELHNYYTNSFDLKIKDNKSNSFILSSILELMDIDKHWKDIEIHNRALNGYRFSWIIGEYIRINFAGPKMLDDNYSTQLLLSGKACREFETYYKGSFIDLFDFLFNEHEELGYIYDDNGEIISGRKLNGSFKRIDIAIDDFTGKEQNIYDLEQYAQKHWWIGSFKSVNVYDSSIRNGYIESKGFTISFGSPGSNRLVIYDKLLERKSAGDQYSDSEIWFRYEMQFVHDKADQVARFFTSMYKLDNLNEAILGLLNNCIEFKDIKDKNKSDFSRQYLRSQPTLESWNNFINHTKKIKLLKVSNPIKTIDKKLFWIDKSLTTTFAELYLINRDNPDEFHNLINKYVNKGMLKLSEQQLTAINKYLKANNKEVISDEEYLKIKNYGLNQKGKK